MEKIDFEDIRVGDKIKVVDHYESDDLVWLIFTVKRIKFGVLYGTFENLGVNENAPYGASRYWYLVERSKPTFKVGDTITGEQVADLPDGAVFYLYTGFGYLRYKINGRVYSERGPAFADDMYRERDFRDIKIVFLPEA